MFVFCLVYTHLNININNHIYNIINIIITIKEVMKVTFTSKVQKHGGSKLISIPKTITDVYGIDKGDTIIWEFDVETKSISLKKLE